MTAYYNEIDPYAAQWLRNLISGGNIAPGDVDNRSILEVTPDDLQGYDQCHFFAGIGGWSYAMRLAGWPDDRPVWTGSCPCQPFSVAGAQRGFEDDRHLWPAFFKLIRECRPRSVFGEQVAGAAGLAWLDHVCADLESAGYAAAAADLPACSVGAPHKRQRLFWVAHAELSQLGEIDVDRQDGRDGTNDGWQKAHGLSGACREVCDVAHSEARGFGIDGSAPRNTGHAAQCNAVGGLADSDGRNTCAEREQCGGEQRQQQEDGRTDPMGNAGNEGLEIERRFPGVSCCTSGACERETIERTDALAAWADLEWIKCSDGKARPTQPGLFPLAHGIPNRVGRLRAYGNAIVPQVAACFVMATML